MLRCCFFAAVDCVLLLLLSVAAAVVADVVAAAAMGLKPYKGPTDYIDHLYYSCVEIDLRCSVEIRVRNFTIPRL